MDHVTHTFAELFCGPGGMSSGFMAKAQDIIKDFPGFSVEDDLHHFEPLWALDNNPDAVETYRLNHPGAEVVCMKAEDCDFATVPDVEGLLFGFPCNDFSAAGPRTGLKGSYGGLFKEGLRFIEERDVDWWVAENVGGLRSDDGGKTIQMMLDVMAECGSGYQVTAHFYHMEEYVVPQKRHRVIIVGIANRLRKKFRVPASPGFPERQVQWAVYDIPEDCPNHEMPRHTQDVKDRLALIPEGENVWYLETLEKEWVRILDEREDMEIRARLIRLRQLMRKKTEVHHSYIYRRLRRDEPAYTVTGSGGGGTHMYHWEENRTMTNRERARIQTFSDDFVFTGKTDSVRRQIGMAVPPFFAAIIAWYLAKTLGGEHYGGIDANIGEPERG